MSETENIKKRYEKRNRNTVSYSDGYSERIVAERNAVYAQLISNNFTDLSEVRFLEMGAGTGGNIGFVKSLGIKSEHIFANELISDRVTALRKNHPDIQVIEGNALEIDDHLKFDIIFQSTVFTSILDDDFRKKLAVKMLDMLRPGGIVLWYDFIYNNPKNPDVKKVSVAELKKLFEKGRWVHGRKITLAPPIGRRVGRMYSWFNCFPFLRSHYVAVIQKK